MYIQKSIEAEKVKFQDTKFDKLILILHTYIIIIKYDMYVFALVYFNPK